MLIKLLASIASVILGSIFIFFGLLGGLIDGFFWFLSATLLGIAFALPGAWWLIHSHRERKGAAPLDRHWRIVAGSSVISAILGLASCSGVDLEPTSTQPTRTTSATPTTSAEPAKSTTKTTQKKPTKTSEHATSTPTPTLAPEPSTEPAAERKVERCGEVGIHETGTTFYNDGTTGWSQECSDKMLAEIERQNQQEQQHGFFAPAPELAPAPAPAPAPEPEPAPAPAAYYPNCAAVRAAGAAPIYAGQPGYGTHLDRDGDGVACEK